MTTSLFNAVKAYSNQTETTNGMAACRSTLSHVLDLFAQGASLRRNPAQVAALVREAYREDKLNTLRCLFYLRDFRGNSGQGERAVFREGLREVVALDTDRFLRSGVLQHIPFYGRWDDVLALLDVAAALDSAIIRMLKEQLQADTTALQEQGDTAAVSLLAKWLPSCNTSSAASCALARRLYRAFGMNERQYRKTLVALRGHLDVLETRLTRRDYSFDYSKLPSCAGMKYRNAFYTNDAERYSAYVQSLKKSLETGDSAVKVNTAALYPYEIVNKFSRAFNNMSETEAQQLDNMWRSLPDYFGEASHANWLAVVDTSGSMTWGRGNPLPIDVAVSLGLYVAERNRGLFRDKMITFSTRPSLVEVDAAWPLRKKVEHVYQLEWGGSTNLEAVFSLVLEAAVAHRIPVADMPEALVIISDMQFNDCVEQGGNPRAYEMIRQKYAAAGYAVPQLVFWNAAQHNYGNLPVTRHELGATLVGGCKPGMFEQLLSGKTPQEFMLDVLGSERYAAITLID